MTTTLGDVTGTGNAKRSVCLMTAQAANNNAPTDGLASTAGVPNYPNSAVYGSDSGACYTGRCAETSTLAISSSAGSGTMVGTFTLWGYLAVTGVWYPILVNAGSALAETAADKIRYAEKYTTLGHWDRLYLQLSAVGGTLTAFEAWLTTGAPGM